MKAVAEKYKQKFENVDINDVVDMEEYKIEPSRTGFFKWDEDDKRGEKHNDQIVIKQPEN